MIKQVLEDSFGTWSPMTAIRCLSVVLPRWSLVMTRAVGAMRDKFITMAEFVA